MENLVELLYKPLVETLYMIGVSMIFSVIIGLILGTVLVVTSENHIMPSKIINTILSNVINITRSFPFIILLIVLFPLTKLIVGTKIGTTAAIVPLSFAATPFFARMVETALRDIPWGIIEAALAMGSTPMQIIIKVMIPEAMPSIIQAVTTTTIGVLGYSAMAGSIGGGGLGDLAIVYGYQRWRTDIMVITVIVLIVLVVIIQLIGDFISRKIDKR
ncbi:ABC transporter, permease protein [Peptostreptococcaceae bacterium AS15]|jgi:metal ion ABC superfamily ATP binding cassette transporter, membrane protein|nr:ABC transporter, permease protein [Peptostreptococcaceae bacterium AS15]